MFVHECETTRNCPTSTERRKKCLVFSRSLLHRVIFFFTSSCRLELQHGFSLPVPQLEGVRGGVCAAVRLRGGRSHVYAREPSLLPGGKSQNLTFLSTCCWIQCDLKEQFASSRHPLLAPGWYKVRWSLAVHKTFLQLFTAKQRHSVHQMAPVICSLL